MNLKTLLKTLMSLLRRNLFLSKAALLDDTTRLADNWQRYQQQEDRKASRIETHIQRLEKEQAESFANASVASDMAQQIETLLTKKPSAPALSDLAN